MEIREIKSTVGIKVKFNVEQKGLIAICSRIACAVNVAGIVHACLSAYKKVKFLKLDFLLYRELKILRLVNRTAVYKLSILDSSSACNDSGSLDNRFNPVAASMASTLTR